MPQSMPQFWHRGIVCGLADLRRRPTPHIDDLHNR